MIHYDIFTNNKNSLEILCFISFWGFYCTLLYRTWNIAMHIPIILLKKIHTWHVPDFSATPTAHIVDLWIIFPNDFLHSSSEITLTVSLFSTSLTDPSEKIILINFNEKQNYEFIILVCSIELNFRQKRHWAYVM